MADGIHFEDNTRRVLTEIQRAAAGAVTKGILILEGGTKLLTRVDSGDLRDSWTHDVEVDGNQVVARMGSPLDYAIYREFGTGEFAENGAGRKGGWNYQTPDGKWHFTMGNKPDKMVRTSFQKNKPKVKEILASELGSNLGR